MTLKISFGANRQNSVPSESPARDSEELVYVFWRMFFTPFSVPSESPARDSEELVYVFWRMFFTPFSHKPSPSESPTCLRETLRELYTYDAASRFKSATYTGNGNENYSLPNMSYDKNGNILNLQRNGKNGTTFGAIDNLTYTYVGNKLLSVTDAVNGNEDVGDFRQAPSGGSGSYSYWANGNLKSDANKGINLIEYNTFLKRIKKVTFINGDALNFYYDGSGTLLKKVSTNDTWIYNNELIYKNTGIYQIASPEGRMIPKTGGGVPSSSYGYEFDYRDHQGNLRLSFRDSLAAPVNGVYAPPVITQITEQDPWGLEIKPLSYVNSINSNNFKFLNRLDIVELNGVSDLVNRFYDKQNGRFWSTDPKVDDGQHSFTPFHYSFNNPIRFSDPSGLIGQDCCGELGAAVGGFFEGVGEAFVRNVKAVTVNLPETVQAMATSLSPLGQYQTAVGVGMVYEKTNSDWNTGDTRTRANIVGNVVGEIGIAVAGSKGAGALGKAGVVSDIAKVGEVANVEKSVGGVISGYTRHGLNQAIGRDAGRGVMATEMLDAVKNPKKIITQDNGGFMYKGGKTKVVVNSDGQVISTFGKPRGETIYTHGKGNNALNRAKELGIEYDPKKIR